MATPDESEARSLSLIPDCPIGQWCVETPASAPAALPKLTTVFAIDADDVFAVGDGGTILRRDSGNEWVAMASGTTSNLRGLWGSSSSDVWAGGDDILLHFDGASWSPVSMQMSTVNGIWGTSPSNVWFVGSTIVVRWNGSTFTTVGGFGGLLAVSGTGPNDVWVTGESTWLHRYNGSSWKTVNAGIGSTYRAVLALATNDVWAAGVIPGMPTAHYNGLSWTMFKTAPVVTNAAVFFGMAALASNDVWGVGNSKIGRWNGLAWLLEEPFGSNQGMWSITAVPGHVWVVGDHTLIAHRTL